MKEIDVLIKKIGQLFIEINNMKDRKERIAIREKTLRINDALYNLIEALEK